MKRKLILFTLVIEVMSKVVCAQTRPINYRRTEEQAKIIVDKVLRASPVIDGHNDLFGWYFGCDYKNLAKCPQDIADYPIDKIQKGHTDIPRWRKGGVGGVQLNVFADSLKSFLDAYDLLYRLQETYSKDLKVVTSSADMRKAIANGKIAILPMLEGSVRLENKLSMLRTFYRLGLRCVTFTYYTSDLADGSDDIPKHHGISDLGEEMVKEMNRLGVIIDMSHISSKGMSDILYLSSAPVIFSHSNARAVCDVNRNVPDSILFRLKSNGGILMIDMAPEHTSNTFVRWMNSGDSVYYSAKKIYPDDKNYVTDIMSKWENENHIPQVNIQDVADHFDYVKSLIGVDYIGISGDFDGIEYTVKGLEDVSCFPNILTELARRGWTEQELQKITGENYLRVFQQVENMAKR
jgi:membrane dipeptidase